MGQFLKKPQHEIFSDLRSHKYCFKASQESLFLVVLAARLWFWLWLSLGRLGRLDPLLFAAALSRIRKASFAIVM